jgi:hypothetical protein
MLFMYSAVCIKVLLLALTMWLYFLKSMNHTYSKICVLLMPTYHIPVSAKTGFLPIILNNQLNNNQTQTQNI